MDGRTDGWMDGWMALYVKVYLDVRLHTRTYKKTCAYIHNIYICAHTYVRTCIHVCMCVYIYLYIGTFDIQLCTYIHTYSRQVRSQIDTIMRPARSGVAESPTLEGGGRGPCESRPAGLARSFLNIGVCVILGGPLVGWGLRCRSFWLLSVWCRFRALPGGGCDIRNR